MQTGQRIWKDCGGCGGSGKQYRNATGSIQSIQRTGDTEIDCPECDGLSILPWGWLRDDKENIMPGEGV